MTNTEWKRAFLQGLEWWFIIISFIGVTSTVLSGYKGSIRIFAQIRPLQALEDLSVLLMVIALGLLLMKIHPCFRWWVGSLFTKHESPGNINFLPMRIFILGPIYLMLLAFALPNITMWEENIFRKGTGDWLDAILRSLLFGAVHMIVGVPLGAALVIAMVGLWLSYWYFHGGIIAATVHHTTYDLFVVFALLVGITVQQISQRVRPVAQTSTS